jgi:hypothetical protein
MTRRLLLLLVIAGLALVPVAVAPAAGEKPNVPKIRRALEARLQQQHLRVRHVFCIVNGRAYKQHAIVRCNVDFGEPHITAYCSVLIGGRLVTQFDVKAIPCHRDNAGDTTIIVTSDGQAGGAGRSPG